MTAGRNSVFVRLMLILVVAGALINFLVFSSLRYVIGPSEHLRPPIEVNISRYVDYLVDDLVKDPSLAHAQALVKGYGLEMRARGAVNWQTREGLPDPKLMPPPPEGHHHGPPMGPPFRTVSRDLPGGPTAFTVYFPPGPHFGIRFLPLLQLILFLTGIVFLSYLAIRHTLAPLHDLTQGVVALGQGKFDHTVAVRGNDEFARLAGSFNGMARQIKDMIAAKEQLLLDVSHELRTPVARAKIALELLPPSPIREDLGGEILEMETMVGGLLESARLSSPHRALNLAPTHLGKLAAEVVEKFQGSSPRVEIAAGSADPVLSVDPERIKTVIKNLVENSRKYSPPESAVEVAITDEPDAASLRVSDRGCGIPASELARVFEPFYRVDKSRNRDTGGFGLGLNLCKKIVEAHGGGIELVSRENGGTTVTLRIPKV